MARQRNNATVSEAQSRSRNRDGAKRSRSSSYSDERVAHAVATAFSVHDARSARSARSSEPARSSRQVLWSEQFAKRNTRSARGSREFQAEEFDRDRSRYEESRASSRSNRQGSARGESRRARTRVEDDWFFGEQGDYDRRSQSVASERSNMRMSSRTRADESARETQPRATRRNRAEGSSRNAGTARRNRTAAPSRGVSASSRAYEAEAAREDDVRAEQRETTRAKKRRERTKARADKMFDRQFAAEATGASAQDAGPRAAVYEGKMGAKHRKSARMQQTGAASAAGDFVARINPAQFIAGLPISARMLRTATAVICAVLVCVTMYTPAQQYYQALRERDQLAAEYSVVADRNQTLDVQNDVLASDAGMEDAVRQKYGYVKLGEETAVVTGLSEHASDSSRGNDGIEPTILSSSVKAPEEWYTPFLDAFFGIE